jgi:thiamine-phosphate pyrophosphorylase
MILPNLIYITHPQEDFENFSWLHRLGENGVKWVQLRIKEKDFENRFPKQHYKLRLVEIAEQMKVICDHFGMFLSINDHPEILTFVDLDGVHVGMEDDNPAEIRAKVGETKIIGCTANSIIEIQQYATDSLNYFGVGPFRLTNTKEKLKPILGLEGFKTIISDMHAEGIFKPIFAIGGIIESDIKELIGNGVHGIALSGLLFDCKHSAEKIKEIVALSTH